MPTLSTPYFREKAPIVWQHDREDQQSGSGLLAGEVADDRDDEAGR